MAHHLRARIHEIDDNKPTKMRSFDEMQWDYLTIRKKESHKHITCELFKQNYILILQNSS